MGIYIMGGQTNSTAEITGPGIDRDFSGGYKDFLSLGFFSLVGRICGQRTGTVI
jgi:hypothetical protein